MFFGGGGDRFNRLFKGQPFAGRGGGNAQVEIGGANKQPVNAFNRGDLFGVGDGLRCLHLGEHKGFVVGVGVVGAAFIPDTDAKVTVKPRSIHATVAQRRIFGRLYDVIGHLWFRDQGHQEAGGPIFQITVEAGAFQGGWADHTIDVELITERDHRLHLALVHGAVFEIKPDAIIFILRGITNKKG